MQLWELCLVALEGLVHVRLLRKRDVLAWRQVDSMPAAASCLPFQLATLLGNHLVPPLLCVRHVMHLNAPELIRPLAWPNRVRDVVALGRFSHGVAPGKLSGHDAEAVTRALMACDLSDLKDRTMDTLSGGELARVHCARAFAAEAPLLIADEPTAALDPRHQFRILDLIRKYVETGGGAMIVLHDIELAARYASRLIWMKGGKILADGPVGVTLTPERLAEIYGVSARIDGTRVVMDGAL